MHFKPADNPDFLLSRMQDHERALAALYQTYSQRFENDALFWSHLAQEEYKHAACLGSLRNQLSEDSDMVIVERFATDAINTSIEYVNGLIDRAGQPEFSLLNALSLALKLEEALIEKGFFEVLSGDSQEIREVLTLLENETQGHSKVLRDALRKCKDAPINPSA
jgi:hypothetical protein